MSLPRTGRYELLEPLGSGGMAELFLARVAGDTRGHVFALKRVLPQYARDRRFREMFEREVGIASTVCHPNLVPVLDHGEADGQCFMVMEYVHGVDLATLLDASVVAGRETPIHVAISIVVEAAEGLHHLHEQPDRDGWTPQLVHRDVSPSNVLIGFDGAVKVADFGIATATAHTRTTEAGTLKGKAGYMSPEQCRGDALDRRSDVFALGILLYETTVGERLFVADNDYALMNKIIGGRFDPPSRRRSGYPPGLESIVGRALALRPDRRYASAAELAEALRRFAQASHHALGTAHVSAWVAELIPPRSYPAFPPTPAPPPPSAPATEPRRRHHMGWIATAGVLLAAGAAAIAAAQAEPPSSAPSVADTADGQPPAPPLARPSPRHGVPPTPPAIASPPPPGPPTVASPTEAEIPTAAAAEAEPEPADEIVIVDEDAPREALPRKRKRSRKRGGVDSDYDLDAPRPPQ